MSKSWAWLLLCLSSIACAQSIVIPVSQCVVHAGDNPAWAKPNLDESGWKPSTLYDFSFNQPRLWMRCEADLAGICGLTDPAIQVSAPAACEACFDGRLVGRFGSLHSMDQIRLLRRGTEGAALAIAAQQFGQKDDITVLTLAFAPVEVLHA